MILNKKLTKYLDELLKLDIDDTEELYSYLVENKFPVVGRDTAKFLAQIVLIKQPEKILEIGTNVGFSALTMAKVLKKGMIYTVDYREDLQKQALENFKKFGVEDKIKLIMVGQKRCFIVSEINSILSLLMLIKEDIRCT